MKSIQILGLCFFYFAIKHMGKMSLSLASINHVVSAASTLLALPDLWRFRSGFEFDSYWVRMSNIFYLFNNEKYSDFGLVFFFILL
jgi:hypothetical protein